VKLKFASSADLESIRFWIEEQENIIENATEDSQDADDEDEAPRSFAKRNIEFEVEALVQVLSCTKAVNEGLTVNRMLYPWSSIQRRQ